MFSKAALYDETSKDARREAGVALDKYSSFLRWRTRERVLDVGCGPGNTLSMLSAHHLPSDFMIIVGLDISEVMVKYATENNTDPRVRFIQSDITEVDFKKLKDAFVAESIDIEFDKIFSFTALHWAFNYEQWASNMYSLLKPGGQVFLMFLANCKVTDVWNEVISSKKWLPYARDIVPVKLRYQDSDNVDGDVAQLMTNAGFVIDSCAHFLSYADFSNTSEPYYRGLTEAINPFIERIPQELRENYLDDIMQTGRKMQETLGKPGVPLTNVVVVATKPERFTSTH